MYNLGGLKFLEKQHCLVLGVSHYCAMAATHARIRSTGKRERESCSLAVSTLVVQVG
jgi:hypothetical protein